MPAIIPGPPRLTAVQDCLSVEDNSCIRGFLFYHEHIDTTSPGDPKYIADNRFNSCQEELYCNHHYNESHQLE